MGLWKRFSEWMGRRSKRYHDWTMKNLKKNINENFNYYYREVGFMYLLTMITVCITMLLALVIILRPNWIEFFVRLWLRI